MRDAVSWIACGLLLPGIYLMGKKRSAGFVLAIIANVLWITWGALVHAWAVVAESCLIIVMYGRSLAMWLAQERQRRADIDALRAGIESARAGYASGRPP